MKETFESMDYNREASTHFNEESLWLYLDLSIWFCKFLKTIVQLQLSVYHRKITAVNRQQSWSNKNWCVLTT